ncbi:hypothetical protein NX009_08040 [Klebsiella pneumoniae]|nr:hypothetical protein [Klebsiella pneumoniae]
MMPLSPQLQQHWQTVADRLPTDFPVAELSPQARSVMVFSDFVEQSVIAQPGWLNELADSARRRKSGGITKPGCRSACRPSLTKRD